MSLRFKSAATITYYIRIKTPSPRYLHIIKEIRVTGRRERRRESSRCPVYIRMGIDGVDGEEERGILLRCSVKPVQ
jgi:hypothetical protein